MAFVDTSDEVIKQMRNAARRGCRKIAKKIVDETVMKAPNRRGYVRVSLKFGANISRQTGQASGKVGYLSKRKLKSMGMVFVLNPSWLEFGTKPHTINSGGKRKDGVKKKGLANKSSNTLFGKSVQHPGSKPVPMLKEAAKLIANDAERIAATELAILNEINERLTSIPDDGNDDV